MLRIGQRRGQEGFALLEVLMAAIILGIAVMGVSLLLSHAQMAVVGQGDRYVALYLAQQKLESLTALALTNPPTGFDTVLPMGTSTESNLQAGEAVGAALQRFTRTTCINFVLDNDPTNPSGCTACTGAGCTFNTKRITVTVTPSLPGADPANPADSVTLVTAVTRHPAN